MPKKTPEPVRDQVLQLVKQGVPNRQIMKQTGIKSQYTIWQIKKEAGLSKTAPPASPATSENSRTPTPPLSSAASGVPRSTTRGNGLDEYQPPGAKLKRKLYAECSDCGADIEYDENEKVEACPGCGVSFE